MCGPRFCSMKITEEVREYAKRGLKEKAEEFRSQSPLSVSASKADSRAKGTASRSVEPRRPAHRRNCPEPTNRYRPIAHPRGTRAAASTECYANPTPAHRAVPGQCGAARLVSGLRRLQGRHRAVAPEWPR